MIKKGVNECCILFWFHEVELEKPKPHHGLYVGNADETFRLVHCTRKLSSSAASNTWYCLKPVSQFTYYSIYIYGLHNFDQNRKLSPQKFTFTTCSVIIMWMKLLTNSCVKIANPLADFLFRFNVLYVIKNVPNVSNNVQTWRNPQVSPM